MYIDKKNKSDNLELDIKTCVMGGFDKKDVIRYIEEIVNSYELEKENWLKREQVLSSMILEAKIKADEMIKYANDVSERITNEANDEAQKIIDEAKQIQNQININCKNQILNYNDRINNMKNYILTTQKNYQEACQNTLLFLENSTELLEENSNE